MNNKPITPARRRPSKYGAVPTGGHASRKEHRRAREYAEEIYRGSAEFIDEVEQVMCWLSRRYNLVEKEAVRKWTGVKLRLPELRERVLICEINPANQYKIYIGKRVPSSSPDGWDWNQSTKESVIAWMPLPKYPAEITKDGQR